VPNAAIISAGMNILWGWPTCLECGPRTRIPRWEPVSPDNKILSMGYNGFPKGCSDDEFPWERENDNDRNLTKYPFVTHSELNAILNYRGGSLEGTKLYVSLFPCNECAKAIIQAGIRTVVYDSDKYAGTPSNRAAKRMFEAAGVNYVQYRKTGRMIRIEV
jgi:dCMP deaminase